MVESHIGSRNGKATSYYCRERVPKPLASLSRNIFQLVSGWISEGRNGKILAYVWTLAGKVWERTIDSLGSAPSAQPKPDRTSRGLHFQICSERHTSLSMPR
jgi:hypothetical protein